ncbi:MAG: hypothetical protein HEEMFOPI_01207 [Holosporales bacterium]
MIITLIRDLKSDFSALLKGFKELPTHLKIVGMLYFLLCPLTFFNSHSASLILCLTTLIFFLESIKNNNLIEFFQKFYRCINKKKLVFSIFFVLWIVLSSLWTEHSQANSYLLRFFRYLIPIICLFVFMKYESEKEKKMFIKFFILGGLLASMLLLTQFFSNCFYKHVKWLNPETEYSNLLLIISSIVFIVLYLEFNTNVKKILILYFLFVILKTNWCDTAILSLVFSGLVVRLLKIDKTLKNFLLFYSSFIFYTFPFIVQFLLSSNYFLSSINFIKEQSWINRLGILKRSADFIFEEPLIGHGPDSFFYINETIKMNILNLESTITERSTYAHNHIMQFWSEFGLIGIFFYSLLHIFIVQDMFLKENKKLICFYVALQAQLLVAVNIWYGWWWSFVFLIFPLLIDNEAKEEEKEKDAKI